MAQEVREESDGLRHGPAGPPGPMASSALKDCVSLGGLAPS